MSEKLTKTETPETTPDESGNPEPGSGLLAPAKTDLDKNIPKFSAKLNPETLETEQQKIETRRQLAESDRVSLLELQSGWEWMEEDVSHEEKYAKMAQMYLTKREDSFYVKPELDRNSKIKFGIGAGDLLPPSIKKVVITDSKGNRRIGTREIRPRKGISRVGYYDEQGYIPIFGGYKLTPIEYLKESSQKISQVLEIEEKIYKRNLQITGKAIKSIITTPNYFPKATIKPSSNMGMNLNQALAYAKTQNLSKLLGAGGHQKLNTLLTNRRAPITNIRYDFDALSNQYNCTDTGPDGKSCCAYMTSRMLGLRQENGKGLIANVSGLASGLIKGIYEKTEGKTHGIVFGMENYEKGDVIVWNGYKDKQKFSHIAAVRETLTIEGEKFIVIQHDYKHLQIDIVPVNPNTSIKKFAEYLKPNGLQRLDPETREKLQDIIKYRKDFPKLVRFRPNRRWFGDSTKKTGGNVAFAIRASILQS